MQKKKDLKWLKDFKIAIIEKDFNKIEQMINDIPKFDTLEENQEALSLVKQANEITLQQREMILKEMQRVKNIKKFLTENQYEKKGEFDINL